jgi:HEAT repeat protein
VRRTPLIALALAPVALIAALAAWNELLLPLGAKLWRSETSLRARAAAGSAPMRIRAMRDAAGLAAPDAALIALLVEHAQKDPARAVRIEAWRSLGAVGARQALPPAALAAFADAVLHEQDDALLAAAVAATGEAAAHNRVGADVVLRIAHISDEKHAESIYPRAIDALAAIGAAQPLPDAAYATLTAEFDAPPRAGAREDLARAFETIARGKGRLPQPLLEALERALANDPNQRVRVHALYALAHSAARYPQAKMALIEATRDGVEDVRRAADNGLRIIEAERLFAAREPIEVALDRSLAVESRLKAMPLLRVNRRDAGWRAKVIALMRDDDPRISVAALELTAYVAGGPDDRFDRDSLIPQLRAAMTQADPQLRRAGYAALGKLLRSDSRYRGRAADFRAQLEAGARDPEPPVRVVAFAILLRTAPSMDARTAVLERALADPDPYVRRSLVGWLGTPRAEIEKRETLLEHALNDPDPDVRRAAEGARRSWEGQPRSWPLEWWALLRAGEYAEVALSALTAATVAAPILVCVAFLVYFVARLLVYLYARRWRALAALGVSAVWIAASHGMFLLYFMAAHARSLEGWALVGLAGMLWIAVVLYAALGWVLHYAVRR